MLTIRNEVTLNTMNSAIKKKRIGISYNLYVLNTKSKSKIRTIILTLHLWFYKIKNNSSRCIDELG